MLENIKNILSSRGLSLQAKAETGKNLPLAKGEIVSGKVLHSKSPNEAVLLIKGREMTAQSSVALEKGQSAFFKVEQTEPVYILKMVQFIPDDSPKASSVLAQKHPYKMFTDFLKPFVSGKEAADFPKELLKLWNLMQDAGITSKEMLSPAFLRSFIEMSGMLWENKLKQAFVSGKFSDDKFKNFADFDLKGLALKLIENFGKEDSFFKEVLSGFAKSLEQLQLLNLSALEEKGKLFFMIPMYADGNFNFGQLLIDLSGKKSGGDDEKNKEGMLRVSILLQMSNIGPVRADALLFQNTVKADFWLSSERVARLFNAHISDLKEAIEQHGFYLQTIACHVLEPKVLEQTSLMEEILDEHHSLSIVV